MLTTRPLIRLLRRTAVAAAYSSSSSSTIAPPSPTIPAYEKQQDTTPEPSITDAGTRKYVVSPKENAPYDVPGGPYATSDPYVTPPPPTHTPELSSTASTAPGPAHPNTTQRVPHHPDGVGESASVRFRSAPGTMGARGGSDGGLDLMDAVGTTGSKDGLAERNPQPTEEGGKQGLHEAWKHRK